MILSMIVYIKSGLSGGFFLNSFIAYGNISKSGIIQIARYEKFSNQFSTL